MGKITLITGGGRSGKSTYAEEKTAELGDKILYIATAIPFDDEMKDRIKLHKQRRPNNWDTVEEYKNVNLKIKEKLSDIEGVMVDCITVMITNLMFEVISDWEKPLSDEIDEAKRFIETEINTLLEIAKKESIPFVIVTNEIGLGIVPDNLMARIFRDIAGLVNQKLAKEADEVYMVISGIPVKIK